MISKIICKEIRQVNNGFVVELCQYDSTLQGYTMIETICLAWPQVIELLNNEVIMPITTTAFSEEVT